jgi:ribonuclease M5
VIREALKTCRTERDGVDRYTQSDMVRYGLCGGKGSKDLRIRIGRILGLGYGNTLQFMRRLNHFDISQEELQAAIKEATHERETI